MEQEVCPACDHWDEAFQRCWIIGLHWSLCNGDKFKTKEEWEGDDE